MRRSTVLLLALLVGVLIASIVDGMNSTSPETPVVTTTTVPVSVGCTGSISFRIEEDGSVTSWCNEEVTK